MFYIFVRSGLEEKHTTKIMYRFIRLQFSVKITGPVNSIKKKQRSFISTIIGLPSRCTNLSRYQRMLFDVDRNHF